MKLISTAILLLIISAITVGGTTVQVHEGWNYLYPPNMDSDLLSNLDSNYLFGGSIYNFDNGWKTATNPNKAVVFNPLIPGQIEIIGTDSPSTISVVSGWNLIGFPTNVNVNEIDVVISGSTMKLDIALSQGIMSSLQHRGVTVSGSDTLEIGKAYWISSLLDAELQITLSNSLCPDADSDEYCDIVSNFARTTGDDCAFAINGVDGIAGNADDGSNIHPGAVEVCGDGIDQNCDGVVDEGCATCGNGIVEPGEACDDGNTANGDGCSSTCAVEVGITDTGVVDYTTAPSLKSVSLVQAGDQLQVQLQNTRQSSTSADWSVTPFLKVKINGQEEIAQGQTKAILVLFPDSTIVLDFTLSFDFTSVGTVSAVIHPTGQAPSAEEILGVAATISFDTSVSCTDDCSTGISECTGDGYRTCGNYDADACAEWSSVTSCSAGQTCSNGQCLSSWRMHLKLNDNAFDEVTGSTGTESPGTGYAPGVEGNAISFNGGTGKYVSLGTRQDLKMGHETTLSAWVFPTGSGSDSNWGGIIVNREGEYQIARKPSGEIIYSFAINSPAWGWVGTGQFAPLNQWTHVALTYSWSAQQINLYINGEFKYTITANGNIGDMEPSQNDFRIGNRQSTEQQFHGNIDNVRVYSNSLSASEVGSIYDAEVASCGITSWTPSLNGKCGSLTQTSDCGTTRSVAGSLVCGSNQICQNQACVSSCPVCTSNQVCSSGSCVNAPTLATFDTGMDGWSSGSTGAFTVNRGATNGNPNGKLLFKGYESDMGDQDSSIWKDVLLPNNVNAIRFDAKKDAGNHGMVISILRLNSNEGRQLSPAQQISGSTWSTYTFTTMGQPVSYWAGQNVRVFIEHVGESSTWQEESHIDNICFTDASGNCL